MIIGLSGYARSGKDTVAQYLASTYDFSQYSFAEPIKKAVYTLNPKIDKRTHYADIVDEYGLEAAKSAHPEIRRLLQVFGTEVGRKMFGENFWVDLCLNNIRSERAVISDVRFPNEAEAIRNKGGFVYRINRPNIEAVNTHISETALDDFEFDEVITNSGTLYDLEVLVDIALVNSLGTRTNER
jgi:hypothetical protein